MEWVLAVVRLEMALVGEVALTVAELVGRYTKPTDEGRR